ncbi:MAG TPA: sorbosone dehydrogenase family protein [Xanthobacteraceae bacterium]|nr:sorbosone dehydrogenase family protein [Xanthobacteraceae bacterium]
MRGEMLAIPVAFAVLVAASDGAERGQLLTGAAAFGDWRADAPMVRRKITPADLPPPFATRSADNDARVVRRPASASPQVPPGFRVALFASGFKEPRSLVTAPNGDIFVAETEVGRIRVLRAADGDDQPRQTGVFASGLDAPFGVAFYPPGGDPQWVYVAETGSVVRFAYRNGDLAARGRPEPVVRTLPKGGHTTRDLVFSPDGRKMFVSVGSAGNAGEGMKPKSPDAVARWDAAHGTGAAWDDDTDRAAVLVFDPGGRNGRIFAGGLRNCVGLAIHPRTGDLWCSVNERDGLGDDLVPDYVTRVRDRSFFGWPWYYIGAHPDPGHPGARPDLKDKITVPDILLQAHSASLHLAFYAGTQFPADYRGDAFVAEHGSWNRAKRTGYKVIRIHLNDGVPSGEYEDFLTGFVVDDSSVWGRPVGVTVAHDGALLVSEDANGTIWRVTYGGP